MDFLIFLIILYFRNVIEEPSLPVKSQKGRSTGLGEDFKEKGVQPVILFLVSVMKAFIIHIGKDIGLYFFFLDHSRHISVVYISGCSQETVNLTVQLIYLFQKIFYL